MLAGKYVDKDYFTSETHTNSSTVRPHRFPFKLFYDEFTTVVFNHNS